MASRKSKFDVLKNEKYMNDAASSVFLNLHKAAKRKTQYIWADKGFSSLDCIYNKPTELKTCKTLDNLNVKKNTKHDLKYDCEISQKKLNQKQSLLPNSVPKKDEKKTVYFVSESKHSDLINGKLVSNGKISGLTGSNQTSKADKPYESSVKEDIHEGNLDIGIKISKEKQNFSDVNSIKTENRDKGSFENAQTYNFGISVPAYDVALNKDVKSSNDKTNTEIRNNYQRNKINDQKVQQNKLNERTTKRHLSSSVNSLFPEQKSVENQKYSNESQNCEKRRDFFKTILLLKIFKNDQVFEFTLDLKDFERMIKRFPKLQEVLPEIDKEEKEVEFSADAVRVVFGFLRSLRYDVPDDRTSVEVLAAFKSWGIDQFRTVFQDQFIANFNKKNTSLAYRAAVHYGLEEICDALKRDCDLPCDDRRYKQKKCYISLSTYVEPREFRIPSKTTTSILQDNFDRDIKNEIVFKAIGGSYVITGFHILLNLDNKKDTDLAYLDITSYVVKNQQSYEHKVRKPLRSNIAINLKKNLEVDKDETVEISVETTVKPYLCLAIKENYITKMSKEEQFCITLKSNFKVFNSNAQRFFVGKLLYYPKT